MGYFGAFLGRLVVRTGHIGVASATVLGETPLNARKQPKIRPHAECRHSQQAVRTGIER